jgi:hypothetical protein
MAGKIKKMIDSIIEQRAKDNAMLAGVIKTKLMLKGIDPGKFTPQSDERSQIINSDKEKKDEYCIRIFQ